MDPNTADGAEGPDNIVGRSQSRTEADHFNDNIGPSSVRYLLNPLQDVFMAVCNIEWLSSQALRGSETTLNGIDRKKVLGLVLECRNDGAEPDRPATDDDGRGFGGVLCSQPGEPPLRAKEPSGKHVGHENEGVIAYLWGRLQHCAVGQRHSHVFRLTAWQTFGTEHQAVDTPGGEPVLAVETLSAAETWG